MDGRKNNNWKYLVLLACFLTTMFSSFIFLGFGALVLPWMEEFSGSAGTVAIITSCGNAFSGLACQYVTVIPSSFCILSIVIIFPGPVGSLIAQKWNYQRAHILGGILMFVSFTSSAFAWTLRSLFFTYSLVGGTGNALACIGFVNAVNEHFPDNLGVAYTFTNMGYGIGGFLFPLLFEFLSDEYTWRGGMFITGAIMGNLIVCGCLVFPSSNAPPLPCSESCFLGQSRRNAKNSELSRIEKESDREKAPELGTESTKDLKHDEEDSGTHSYFKISKILFTSSTFYIMILHNILNCIGYFIVFGLTSLRAHYDRNLTEEQTTILISSFGVAQLISRPLMAIAVHFKWIKISSIYYSSHFVVALATLLSLCARTFPAQLVYCIVVSAGWSCMSFYLVVVKTIFGSTYYNVVFGHLEVMHGVGSLLGPFIGGTIFDVTGSSQYAFVFAGLSIFLGSSVLILGLILTGRKDKLMF